MQISFIFYFAAASLSAHHIKINMLDLKHCARSDTVQAHIAIDWQPAYSGVCPTAHKQGIMQDRYC